MQSRAAPPSLRGELVRSAHCTGHVHAAVRTRRIRYGYYQKFPAAPTAWVDHADGRLFHERNRPQADCRASVHRARLLPKARLSQSFAVADLSRDGLLDIALTELPRRRRQGTARSGRRRLCRPDSLPAGRGPKAIVAADLDRDGHLAPRSVRVFLRIRADGRFTVSAVVRLAPGLAALTATDYNGDGRIDLATANGAAVRSAAVNKRRGPHESAHSSARGPRHGGGVAGGRRILISGGGTARGARTIRKLHPRLLS